MLNFRMAQFKEKDQEPKNQDPKKECKEEKNTKKIQRAFR